MATLALTAIGSAVGSALLPSGLSVLGSTLTGAAIGQQIGALVGSQIDQALFGAAGRSRAVDGPRLSDLRVTSSTEGAAIPRVYGHARLGGQLIWATALEEEAVSRKAGGGGKGARARSATGTDYAYYANCAVAVAEGEITRIGRVWADNREIDLADVTARIYVGSETQLPDPLIVAKQAGTAPAYRGLAYVVFERLPLADFGNRIPQFSFEVSRAVDSLEAAIKGVALIPGSGEFVYAPDPVRRKVGRITSVHENVHTKLGGSDWTVSLDQLQSTLPNAKSVSLVVSWFGDDLRASHCKIEPRVERVDRITSPISWSVAGQTRATATPVSLVNSYPAYGGTPSDQTVIAAIEDLRDRGLDVVFSPFVLMDVPAGNAKPDPYSAATSQAPYPWRGRITVSPAAGQPGTVDKTAAAQTQLATFIGTAQPTHFAITETGVAYSGPSEWSFRRFILHYAHLCKAAGGVDAFVLCSELRGLTTARSATSTYPFVTALRTLAADVRAILGPTTKILYAADWSEYFGHHPADGSGDVHFHLDPLWASPNIDAIGLDVYWPLADWRDGDGHIDAGQGAGSSHDIDYLKRNLTAGEGFDWYYASAADRAAQVRTPITDGVGKPWVFRFKDLKSWWLNRHRNRIAGVEQATNTAWVPQSKPFWFMEIGCPAVDKGANQPNVFVDAKSAESALPHFSSGARDDLMQRRVLQAMIEGFDPSHPDTPAGANPVSTVTGQRMIDLSRLHVYAWDARPFPAFPKQTDIWIDGENWALGHWINGRAAAAPVPALVRRILDDYGMVDADTSSLEGTANGFVIDRIMSAREVLQPLELAFFFDVLESEGRLRFQPRGAVRTGLTFSQDDLVETRDDTHPLRLVRSQETDLPNVAKITYISSDGDYPTAVAEAQRLVSASDRTSTAALALVLDPAHAEAIADTWLFETWSARERASFTLPPSRLALEPGDVVTVATGARSYPLRISEIGDHGARDIDALAFDADVYVTTRGTTRTSPTSPPEAVGPPLVTFLDIPPADGIDAHVGSIAVAQEPWPGTIAVYASPEQSGYTLQSLVPRSATTGVTTSPLAAGPLHRFDHATTLTIELDAGMLTSTSDLALFEGTNTLAVEVAPNQWEILQFATAELIAARSYRLRTLLRGQRGSDALMAPLVPAGARIVVLDDAVTALDMTLDRVGIPLHWKVGPARRDLGDPSYVAAQETFTGPGLRPHAPVHVRGLRAANGDLTLSWIRRTRTGGDTWDLEEVPLGEADERYRVDILDGQTVKRSITTTFPLLVYTAAAQTADFGALPTAVAVRVAQLSATVGAGHAASHIV